MLDYQARTDTPGETASGDRQADYQNLLCFVFDLGRGHETFETAQQVFLGHPVELRLAVEIAANRRRQGRRRLGFRFVDFDVTLQRVDEILGEIFRRERRFGDFAKGDDGIFVAVAIDKDRLTRRDVPRPMRREKNEVEAVFDFVDAIFDSNARHLPSSSIRFGRCADTPIMKIWQ